MSDVRWATSDDIPELIRFREVLSERMAEDFGPPPAGNDGWRDVFAATVAERLADGSMAVFVVDGDDRPAACGSG